MPKRMVGGSGWRGSRFEPDVRGIGQMMSRQDMRMAMKVNIEAVKAIAISSSPVGDRRKEGDESKPRYVDSFEVDTGIQQGKPKAGYPNRRAFGRLTNTAPHAKFVEYGANGVRKSGVMRRAIVSIPHVKHLDH